MKILQEQIKSPTRRLATQEEINDLLSYLVNTNWNTNVIYASSIGAEAINKGYPTYLKEELQNYKKSIGNFIIVDHFEDCNVLLFIYLDSTFDSKDNLHNIFTNKILKIGNSFKEIDDYNHFNLDQEISEMLNTNKNTKGRPKRPSKDSIIKTHIIKGLIDKGDNVDDACQKTKLAKSTYYRVSKFIIKNSAYKSFPK